MRLNAKVLNKGREKLADWHRSCRCQHNTDNTELGKETMKLRTILSVATIFMVFITVAAWKTPIRGEN